jgi:hypothetical protein
MDRISSCNRTDVSCVLMCMEAAGGGEGMPWKECSVMAERLRFVARRLAGEPMVELCREFAISRKTGYQIFDRYKESGLEALTDHSRGPWRYANQLSQQVDPGHEVPPGKSMPPHPAPVAGCRNSLIRFTTRPSRSHAADASVCTAKKLISARPLESKK